MSARAITLSIVACLAAMSLAVAFGTEPVSLARAFQDPSSLDRVIMLDARLPRVLMGAIVGAGLAAVGVGFQAVLRNPLAEPYVLGVSGGSAFGATLAIVCGLTGTTVFGASLVPVAALAGGVGATALVYFIARIGGSASGASILLAGVVVNAIASAAITFVKTLLQASKAQELLRWLMGFLDVPSTTSLAFVALYVVLGVGILVFDSGRLNLLALGDESATHLGVDVRRLEHRTFFACSLVVAATVSVTGLIGFVGLVVPHALRRIVGPDVRVLLPASLFAGGATLVLCDLVSRALFRTLHTEPPVGAVTALIGGPLFLVLLRRSPLRA
ncbi:MAG: iron ABC transporter permease [Polyangiaceae bacterium]